MSATKCLSNLSRGFATKPRLCDRGLVASRAAAASAEAHQCCGWTQKLRLLAFVGEVDACQTFHPPYVAGRRRMQQGKEAARKDADAETTMLLPCTEPD